MPKGMLGKLPLSAWQGPRDDLEQRLAGEDGGYWLQGLKRFLRKERTRTFPIWRTVQVGGKSRTKVITELDAKGIKMTDWVREAIYRTVVFSRRPRDIQLVRVSVADLGFKIDATTKQIWARAWNLGLQLCPAEVAPFLCLSENHHLEHGGYIFAMESICIPGDETYQPLFQFIHDDEGQWLIDDESQCTTNEPWAPSLHLVFVAPEER